MGSTEGAPVTIRVEFKKTEKMMGKQGLERLETSNKTDGLLSYP